RRERSQRAESGTTSAPRERLCHCRSQARPQRRRGARTPHRAPGRRASRRQLSAVAASDPGRFDCRERYARAAVRAPERRTGWRFYSRLETTGGMPAEPPTLTSAVPNWSSSDTIALGAGRMLRVVDVRDDDADQPPVLVVEDM